MVFSPKKGCIFTAVKIECLVLRAVVNEVKKRCKPCCWLMGGSDYGWYVLFIRGSCQETQ